VLLQHSPPAVLVFSPTDTIYGIIAPAGDKRAVARLYEIKKREGKPGTVIAASRSAN